MSKTNFFVKYLKNISNFINSLLEKNLNKLNFKNLSFLLKNNKIILTFVALFVLFISYLLVPNFYNQTNIAKELKSKLHSKLGLNFKFSQNISYNIFPRPHFKTLSPVIFYNESEISKMSELKIFISLENLFSYKNIKVKDLVFDNSNFNLNIKNYNFFQKLLYKNFDDGNLSIKNSNIFFRDSEQEVLFINKILKIKYYYDSNELKNIFYSDNEIFNIPFSMEMFLSKDKQKIFSNIDVNLIKLKIENELNHKDEKKIGKSEFIYNKLKRIVEYRIENYSLNFHLYDKKDEPKISYRGHFNFKPFYANINGNLDKINLNYLFGSNAIIAELLKTEIFNHKNIDIKINISADNIYNNANFKNLNISSKIHDGLLDTDRTRFKWKNIVDFELLDSLIFVKNGELVLDGKLKININDYNKIYKYLQTPKKYRNKIKQIDLNFNYNFDKNIAELKDIKIDNKINQDINKILNNMILKRDDFQNKIYFKNLLNEAIKNYAG